MPWPRILSDPKRAISPISSPPTTGIATTASPTEASVIAACAVEKRPNQKRFVASAISFSNARSEEHTSELQSLMRISYAVFCLKKKILEIDQQHTPLNTQTTHSHTIINIQTTNRRTM